MCKCNNDGCKVREARGLVAFCEMSAPAAAPVVGYATYAAAVAANPGRRIRSVGQFFNGSPRRFVVAG